MEDVKFTPLQGQYLSFISDYTKINRPPAELDMQRNFQITPPTVHPMVLKLETLGLICRTPRISRSIEVLVPRNQLPCLE